MQDTYHTGWIFPKHLARRLCSMASPPVCVRPVQGVRAGGTKKKLEDGTVRLPLLPSASWVFWPCRGHQGHHVFRAVGRWNLRQLSPCPDIGSSLMTTRHNV